MWLPWRRRKYASTPPAIYNSDGPTLTVQLPSSIGAEHFGATLQNYPTALGAREMPEQLKLLLAELFCRMAITHCKIEFGTRLVLGLATHDSHGRELLAGGRLEYFQANFGEITGQKLTTVWQDSGPTSGAFGVMGGSGLDPDAIGHIIGAAVRGTLEGLQVAAAIQILRGRD